MNEPHD
nr:1,4-beta-D-glucan glucanohydrolase, endoglucanase, cellulase, EG38=peptide III {EC 3.2.1.4} [Phanerochaete chrysosporium, strain K3, Peptide Partial, 6 aa] [Phanerodontia chrysosporium]